MEQSNEPGSRTARAAVFEARETFTLRDIPLPEIGLDDLLIEVSLCGVDGSELHMFRGELPWFNERMPIIFGDEIIGRVAEIGETAAKTRNLAVGDIVAVEARWPCNECRYCKQGQYYLCANNPTGRGYGTISLNEAPGLWGGYATHVYVPKEVLVHRVPEGLALKTALVSCSLLANSISWTDKAELQPNSTVVVIGPGPQGLGCALVAAHRGARVVVVGLERDRERLDYADRQNSIHAVTIAAGESAHSVAARVAEILGEVDVVIETAGGPPAKELAFKLVRRTGIVIQVSMPFPHVQEVDWLNAQAKEMTIFNPISHPNTVAPALALGLELARQGLDVGDFITHSFPLEEAAKAIRTATYEAGEAPIKVVIDPWM